MAALDNFRMPSEPCPLPSLGSEEESFVVLGKSLCDLDESPSMQDDGEPVGSSVVEEARKLINSEIAAIDGSSLSEEQKTLVVNSVESEANSTVLERSAVHLPEMPKVERGFVDSVDAISIATFSNDLSSEEVQSKIAQILEENVHLKDTILQNNMSMKSQYERIVAWQEDVQKVHQAHKDKIYEAKAYIEKLKKENESRGFEMKKQIELLHAKEEELAVLRNTIKELERKSNEQLLQSTDNNLKEFELDVAKNKVKELENEFQKLKVVKDQLNGDLEKMKAYEKTIEQLHEQLEKSQLREEELLTELAKVKYTVSERESILQAQVHQLQQQVQGLAQQSVTSPSSEEFDRVMHQLTSMQVILMQTEQTRTMAYEQISTLNKKIEELAKDNEELRARTRQDDEIYALQTQLEVYKIDFEAERSAKETIREEKDKLTEDLQNLQRRNQQLQEEIELARDHRDFVVYPSPRHTSARNSSSSANDHSFKCPKCGFGFLTLQALENHVYRCIELDDHLP